MRIMIDSCKKEPEKYKAVLCIDSFFLGADQFPDYFGNVVNLNKYYDQQTEKERLRDGMGLRTKITIGFVTGEVGFPLLISMILKDPSLEENIKDFFKNPKSILQERFQNLLKEHIDVYVTLIYAVCKCPVNLKEVSRKKWKMLKKECEEVGSSWSGLERSNEVIEKDIGAHDSPKKINSEISNKTSTTADYSEGVKETGYSAPHVETMADSNSPSKTADARTDFSGGIPDRSSDDDNGKTNQSEEEDNVNDARSGSRSGDKRKVKVVGKRRKAIDMNDTLDIYLIKSEKSDTHFEFRHQFLSESLLHFHINNVGKEAVSKVAKKDVVILLDKL
jgi:hypothetical protein